MNSQLLEILVTVELLSILPYCMAHICLISPRQRGEMNITTSGNPTCFRHGEPCGGQAPEEPRVTLTGGQPAFIKWQQNYNHYSVGYPGYFDVAIGESASPEDFTILAVMGDEYVWAQDYQHNYTAMVTIPTMQCEHCVIRVRYNAHKPGERTFIQCADVRVQTAPKDRLSKGLNPAMFIPPNEPEHVILKKLSFLRTSGVVDAPEIHGSIYGIAFDPLAERSSTYVRIDPMSGEKTLLQKLPFDVDIPDRETKAGVTKGYITDAVLALDEPRDVSLVMENAKGQVDAIAASVVQIGTHNGTITRSDPIFRFQGPPFSAIVFESFGSYLTFSMEEIDQSGMYTFVIGRLNWAGEWQPIIKSRLNESTFINYQWAEFDSDKMLLHVLLGNENDPDVLTARIYTFDIKRSALLSYSDVDVSKFTFMSMQLFGRTGQLLAVSPGLHSVTYPAYSLVEVDPFTGVVTELFKLTPEGIFEQYYGGVIFNGLEQETGLLRHVLRVADTQADVIVVIDIINHKVQFSQLTNLRNVHNLAYAIPNTF